jgi:hypothetical protein
MRPSRLVTHHAQIFNYSRSKQLFICPEGVSGVKAYLWGAAGGSSWANTGGGGGFVMVPINLSAGDTLDIIVGGGGGSSWFGASPYDGVPAGRAGGGPSGKVIRPYAGAAGGDYSAVKINGSLFALAGGGGGGGGGPYASVYSGGPGGGSSGGPATCDNGIFATGGTQSAGGTGGGDLVERIETPPGTFLDPNGSYLLGGAGCGNGAGESYYGGGGGGGGLYGGGGGGTGRTTHSTSSGGGGSSLVPAGGYTEPGKGTRPGGMAYPFYEWGIGMATAPSGYRPSSPVTEYEWGSALDTYRLVRDGGPGRVVITWEKQWT